MIKGVIWDVDGVILDSEQLHAEKESETAKAFGIEISPEEIIRLYSGVHIDTEFEDIARRAGKEMSLKKALELSNRILKEKLKGKIPLIPHVKEAIKALSKKYKIGLATSSEQYFVETALSKHDLLDYFEARVYVRDVQTPKPHPEIFLKAASLLELSSSGVVVVEDSESGFTAAKAAGILLIARKAGHNKDKDFSLADYVVEDLREIPRILSAIV